jgi:hypothetical protein
LILSPALKVRVVVPFLHYRPVYTFNHITASTGRETVTTTLISDLQTVSARRLPQMLVSRRPLNSTEHSGYYGDPGVLHFSLVPADRICVSYPMGFTPALYTLLERQWSTTGYPSSVALQSKRLAGVPP